MGGGKKRKREREREMTNSQLSGMKTLHVYCLSFGDRDDTETACHFGVTKTSNKRFCKSNVISFLSPHFQIFLVKPDKV